MHAPTNRHLMHAESEARYVAKTLILGFRYLLSHILSPASIRPHIMPIKELTKTHVHQKRVLLSTHTFRLRHKERRNRPWFPLLQFWEFIHKQPWSREVRLTSANALCHSTAAKSISKRIVMPGSSKHIYISYLHVKSFVKVRLVRMKYVESDYSKADLLTKVLEPKSFSHLIELVGLSN